MNLQRRICTERLRQLVSQSSDVEEIHCVKNDEFDVRLYYYSSFCSTSSEKNRLPVTRFNSFKTPQVLDDDGAIDES